ncbi:hypothetical protein V5S96_11025 [Corynebacterium mastitidis]|uniref:Uncharacterized protein n=1 Tax=Corynebacterium mastitidis TaxID=161890 RepID=A0ABU8P0S8_9CORY
MEWWSIAFGLTGAITGLGGLLLAQLAHRESKKANRIAKGALTEATEANRIAVDANKLAKDANTISGRALKVAGEDFEYQWGFRVENDGRFFIFNNSPHDALNLTIYATAETTGEPIAPGIWICRNTPRVTFGKQFPFNAESIYPQLLTKTRAQRPNTVNFLGPHPIHDGRIPVKFDIVAVLQWATPGGRECGDVIKHSLSCREGQSGNIVFTMDS